MPPDLFTPKLISDENLPSIVEELRRVLPGTTPTIEVVSWNNKTVTWHEYSFSKDPNVAITYQLARARSFVTNSNFLGFLLEGAAFSFYSCDDPMIKWLAPNVVMIWNQFMPRDGDNPNKKITISILPRSQ